VSTTEHFSNVFNIESTMPPQQHDNDDDSTAGGTGMRRVISQNYIPDASTNSETAKEYNVRKSSLIGYVIAVDLDSY
jgi:hypothetical protein